MTPRPQASEADPAPDSESALRPSRHAARALRRARVGLPLRLRGALLVFAGGAAGTLARYGVSLAVPAPGGWPLATLTVNLTGAFALAFLLEWLTVEGSEPPGRRRVRLLVGSGVISGYTTYSTLAVETERLLATGHMPTAAGYATLTLAGGLVAAPGGYLLAARSRPGHLAVVPEAEKDDL